MARVKQRQAQLMQEVMVGRVRWLINLRWVAAVGLVLTAVAAHTLTPVQFALAPIVVVAVVIASYNALLQWRLHRSASPAAAEASATVQIIADLLCLIALINCTGGLINPLIVFMMFHAAIAGIILPRRRAFLLAGFGTLLVAGMGLAHMSARFGTWRIPLTNFPLEMNVDFHGRQIPLAQHPFVVLIVPLVTGSGLFLSAYFTSGIAAQLRQAYRQLAGAHTELSEREEAKSVFMRTMAHQLRSPLAAITSLINAVARPGAATPERIADIHQRIKARCAAMMDLLDDLLRLAQIQEGSVLREATEPINAIARFAETAASFEALAAEKQIRFIVNVPSRPVLVLAGARDLSDLLGNLVSNAIKYTPAGGSVHVTSRVENDVLVTQVQDTGIGIPEADTPRLFTEFFRAANAKKQAAHSSGLGLSICREMVGRLGGRIRCESTENVGTTFTFELPVIGATCPIPPTAQAERKQTAAARSNPATEGT